METRKQVCSIDQAKRLKELGVIQDALFYYLPDTNDAEWKEKYNLPDYYLSSKEKTVSKDNWTGRWELEKISPNRFAAFTVAELGVMLPDDLESVRDRKNGKYYSEGFAHSFSGTTEAEARAAHLIYLLEGYDVYPDEVNARLTA